MIWVFVIGGCLFFAWIIHYLLAYRCNRQIVEVYEPNHLKMKWKTILPLITISPDKWVIKRRVIASSWDSTDKFTYPIYHDEGISYHIILSYIDWVKCWLYYRKITRAANREQDRQQCNQVATELVNAFQKDIERFKEKTEKKAEKELKEIWGVSSSI